MSRILIYIALGMIAAGLVLWFARSNPPRQTYFHAQQQLTQDIRLKFITEQSEYMRSER